MESEDPRLPAVRCIAWLGLRRAILCRVPPEECDHGKQCKPNESLRHEQQARMNDTLAGISLGRHMRDGKRTPGRLMTNKSNPAERHGASNSAGPPRMAVMMSATINRVLSATVFGPNETELSRRSRERARRTPRTAS
jgi:hypothetical protein